MALSRRQPPGNVRHVFFLARAAAHEEMAALHSAAANLGQAAIWHDAAERLDGEIASIRATLARGQPNQALHRQIFLKQQEALVLRHKALAVASSANIEAHLRHLQAAAQLRALAAGEDVTEALRTVTRRVLDALEAAKAPAAPPAPPLPATAPAVEMIVDQPAEAEAAEQ